MCACVHVRACARVEVSCMAAAAAVGSYVQQSVRVWYRVVECGAECSSVVQSCLVWRRVFVCGTELLSVVQSC